MMKRLLVFRNSLLAASETFIKQQVSSPVIILCSKLFIQLLLYQYIQQSFQKFLLLST